MRSVPAGFADQIRTMAPGPAASIMTYSFPRVAPRVKEPHRLRKPWVKSSNVIEFMAITVRTGISEVARFVRSVMFSSDDVIANKAKLRKGFREVAILAAAGRSFGDQIMVPIGHLSRR